MIFDIGANLGLFTDVCLNKYPNNQVILIEANPNLYEYLLEKYKNNSNVKILNFLISHKTDEYVPFYIASNDGLSTASTDWITKSRFSNKPIYTWNEPILIKSKSIDLLIEEYGNPNLIKVDVEGYEYEALLGLTKKSNTICFEWAEEEYEKLNKTCEYLEKIGYNQFGYIEGDAYMVEPQNYSTWKNCNIHSLIDTNRKEKWGMVWVK